MASNKLERKKALMSTARLTEREFNHLFHTNYDRLFSFCLKLVREECAAEDIVENVMLKLWERNEHLGHIHNVKAYLYTSVRNASYSYLKERKHFVPWEPSMEGEDVIMDYDIMEEEIHATLLEALNSLPEKCKIVFELSCIAGLKYKDIAEDLGISVNTVKSQRTRAVDLLKSNCKHLSYYYSLTLFFFWFFS